MNGNGVSTELSRVIVNGSGSVTRVTVTVRLREAGNYQCTVFNDRVIDGNNGRIGNVQASSSNTLLSLLGMCHLLVIYNLFIQYQILQLI